MRKPKYYLPFLIWVSVVNLCSAQRENVDLAALSYSDSTIIALQQIPSKYCGRVNQKFTTANDQLTRKSLQYLEKFEKQEYRLQRKLTRKYGDSLNSTLTSARQKYSEISQNIKRKSSQFIRSIGSYNPYLDSLGTSLSFLKQLGNGKANTPLESFNQFRGQLAQSEKLSQFLSERQAQIKQLLSSYTHLPPELKKEYENLCKTAYYYRAQVQEFKDMWKDEKKIEQKTLALLRKLPAFQKFMQKNSFLASLFPATDGVNVPNLAGLQTRNSVQALIRQQIASGGPNARAQIQANIAAAESQFNKLKDQLNKFTGSGNSDLSLPDFKPNTQKTKPFLKRLEYGFNIQFARTSSLLPATADIASSIGYKLNDNGSMGIGMSYKVGLGTIQHISITSQGIGLRSYFDWKIKKSFYANSGYEMNYNSAFSHVEQLKDYNAWQRSALIGISKRYKISKKVQGEIKLLYDFLANAHIPVSQPLVFRLGYKF